MNRWWQWRYNHQKVTEWLRTLTINGPNESRNTENPATASTRTRCMDNEVSTGVPSVHSNLAPFSGVAGQKSNRGRSCDFPTDTANFWQRWLLMLTILILPIHFLTKNFFRQLKIYGGGICPLDPLPQCHCQQSINVNGIAHEHRYTILQLQETRKDKLIYINSSSYNLLCYFFDISPATATPELRSVTRHEIRITQLIATQHRWTHPILTPASTQCTCYRGMEGWVDLHGWLYTEMVFLSTDHHPSK